MGIKKFSMPFLENYSSSELEEFLERNQDCLREDMVNSSLDRLDTYLANSESASIFLQLGLCVIQVTGTKEGFIALDLLSKVLENKF